MKFLANLFGSQSADAKTLEQSRAQIAAAKLSAEAVAALFTAASLDLDALLAAGPDSLKAHLASLSAKDADLATAQAKVAELTGKVETVTASLNTANKKLEFNGGLLASIGFTPTATSTEADARTAFASHVSKAAALELAKHGHKPIDDVITKPDAKGAAIDPTLTGAARTQAYFAAKLKAPAAK